MESSGGKCGRANAETAKHIPHLSAAHCRKRVREVKQNSPPELHGSPANFLILLLPSFPQDGLRPPRDTSFQASSTALSIPKAAGPPKRSDSDESRRHRRVLFHHVATAMPGPIGTELRSLPPPSLVGPHLPEVRPTPRNGLRANLSRHPGRPPRLPTCMALYEDNHTINKTKLPVHCFWARRKCHTGCRKTAWHVPANCSIDALGADFRAPLAHRSPDSEKVWCELGQIWPEIR